MKTILNPSEVSKQFFNGQVSYWTVLKMAKNNELPYFKVGHKYFFDLDELNGWVKQQHEAVC